MDVKDVRPTGRNTQGVRVMTPRDGAKVASVAKVMELEDDDEESEDGEATDGESTVDLDEQVSTTEVEGIDDEIDGDGESSDGADEEE